MSKLSRPWGSAVPHLNRGLRLGVVLLMVLAAAAVGAFAGPLATAQAQAATPCEGAAGCYALTPGGTVTIPLDTSCEAGDLATYQQEYQSLYGGLPSSGLTATLSPSGAVDEQDGVVCLPDGLTFSATYTAASDLCQGGYPLSYESFPPDPNEYALVEAFPPIGSTVVIAYCVVPPSSGGGGGGSGGGGGPAPLTVSAGPGQTLYFDGTPLVANLDGTVSGGVAPVTSQWTVTAPPNATATTFASQTSPTTTATFTPPPFPQNYTAGFPGYYTYTETLTATDNTGTPSSSSMNVTVCPDVDLITAQGVTQGGPGLYSPLSDFTQAFINAIPAQDQDAIEVQPIPWASLSKQQLLSDIVTAYKTGNYDLVSGELTFPGEENPSVNSNYYQNVEAGKDALSNEVSVLTNTCPETKLVLLGYSEGSDAVLQYLEESSSPSVKSVYVYGSPRFNPAYPMVNSSGIPFVPSWVDWHEGLLGSLPYPPALTRSTCFPLDPVCQGVEVPPACILLGPEACGEVIGLDVLFGVSHTRYGADANADGAAAESRVW